MNIQAPIYNGQAAPALAVPPAILAPAIPTDAETAGAIQYMQVLKIRAGKLKTFVVA